MASAQQIEANRLNSRKSTGPKSSAGKARSRRNALTHGLSGEAIVLPEGESEAVQERMAEWHSSLRPFDSYQTWLLEAVAIESRRVERCRARENLAREEIARRAEESWGDDRRREAEEVAAWRGSNPSLACARLRSGAAGCRVLLDWWEALGRALDDGEWDEAQTALAHDLLGVPPALRTGRASPLNAASGEVQSEHRRGIVAAEVARLEEALAEAMPARDERARRAAAAGLSLDEGPELARLRRYEGTCMRRLQWAREQIRRPVNKTWDASPAWPSHGRRAPNPEHGRAANPSAGPVPPPDRAGPGENARARIGLGWDADAPEAGPIPPPAAWPADETKPIAAGTPFEKTPYLDDPAADETKPIAAGTPFVKTPYLDDPAADETKPIAAGTPVPPSAAYDPGDETKPIAGGSGLRAGDQPEPIAASAPPPLRARTARAAAKRPDDESKRREAEVRAGVEALFGIRSPSPPPKRVVDLLTPAERRWVERLMVRQAEELKASTQGRPGRVAGLATQEPSGAI